MCLLHLLNIHTNSNKADFVVLFNQDTGEFTFINQKIVRPFDADRMIGNQDLKVLCKDCCNSDGQLWCCLFKYNSDCYTPA